MFVQYMKELERNTFLRFVIPIKKRKILFIKSQSGFFFMNGKNIEALDFREME